MKKTNILIISLVALSVMLFTIGIIKNKDIPVAMADSKATQEEGLKKIKNSIDFLPSDREVKFSNDAKRAGKDVLKYRDNQYEYSFDPYTKHIVSMISLSDNTSKKGAVEISPEQAVEKAKNILKKSIDDFFEGKVVEKVDQSLLADQGIYLIELDNVNSQGRNTGTSASFRVSKYGDILLMSAIENPEQIAAQEPKVSEDKAREIAYAEAAKMANGITNKDDTSNSEKFVAKLNATENHQVTAKTTVFNNRQVWIITIKNVEVNRPWIYMGFIVYVDAETGEVPFETTMN